MKIKFLPFITAAAVFLCTLNTMAASFAPRAGMVKENGIIGADGKVTFIVEVEGDPVLSDIQAMEQGAAVYGIFAKAKSYRDKLLKVQFEIQSDIMETVPDAKKRYIYKCF